MNKQEKKKRIKYLHFSFRVYKLISSVHLHTLRVGIRKCGLLGSLKEVDRQDIRGTYSFTNKYSYNSV